MPSNPTPTAWPPTLRPWAGFSDILTVSNPTANTLYLAPALPVAPNSPADFTGYGDVTLQVVDDAGNILEAWSHTTSGPVPTGEPTGPGVWFYGPRTSGQILVSLQTYTESLSPGKYTLRLILKTPAGNPFALAEASAVVGS